jgi:cohesin complex subunit SA-1/2
MLQSFNMFLDGTESSEEHTIILVKALLPCFVQRGAHLAIVRRLESQHIISVHTSLLTWIGKKIGTFEIKKDKNGRNSAAAFFKVLTPLLVVSLDSRNALRM